MKWKSNAMRNIDEKDGSIFNLKDVGVGISIHKYSGCGDKYYLTCNELGFSRESLQTENFEEAVEIAKHKIIQRFRYLQSEFKKFLDDESENEFTRY